jgi:phosphocarrier protein
VHEATKDVSIVNVQGLHARPIMQFVDLASRFQASIRVTKGEQVVDGKSPMEIMLLEAVCGTQLRLSAHGPDAREAIEALAALVAAGFDEI